jgi:hypothetical protein
MYQGNHMTLTIPTANWNLICKKTEIIQEIIKQPSTNSELSSLNFHPLFSELCKTINMLSQSIEKPFQKIAFQKRVDTLSQIASSSPKKDILQKLLSNIRALGDQRMDTDNLSEKFRISCLIMGNVGLTYSLFPTCSFSLNVHSRSETEVSQRISDLWAMVSVLKSQDDKNSKIIAFRDRMIILSKDLINPSDTFPPWDILEHLSGLALIVFDTMRCVPDPPPKKRKISPAKISSAEQTVTKCRKKVKQKKDDPQNLNFSSTPIPELSMQKKNQQ